MKYIYISLCLIYNIYSVFLNPLSFSLLLSLSIHLVSINSFFSFISLSTHTPGFLSLPLSLHARSNPPAGFIKVPNVGKQMQDQSLPLRRRKWVHVAQLRQAVMKRLGSLTERCRWMQNYASSVLLLGPGESGKSTVFKQMKLLYSVPYSEYELQHYKRIIHENIVKNMKVLLQRAREENLALNDAADAGERIEMLGDDSVLDKTHAEDISLLWKSETIQKCYNDRAELQLNDSAAYYFEKIDGICDPDYQPTNADVLHSRVRTSGIVQSTYEIDGVTFEMYDGQRNERKKVSCFFLYVFF